MSWLQIDSLKSFFLTFPKLNGNYYLKTIITRKKRKQDVREPVKKSEYINFVIIDGKLITHTLTTDTTKIKLISKKQGLLVKHNKEDYKKLHQQLTNFLNNQLNN